MLLLLRAHTQPTHGQAQPHCRAHDWVDGWVEQAGVVDLELCLVVGRPGGCQGVEQLKEGCGKTVQLLQGVKLLLRQAWCWLEVWVMLDGGCQGITGSAKRGHQACRKRGRDRERGWK